MVDQPNPTNPPQLRFWFPQHFVLLINSRVLFNFFPFCICVISISPIFPFRFSQTNNSDTVQPIFFKPVLCFHLSHPNSEMIRPACGEPTNGIGLKPENPERPPPTSLEIRAFFRCIHCCRRLFWKRNHDLDRDNPTRHLLNGGYSTYTSGGGDD